MEKANEEKVVITGSKIDESVGKMKGKKAKKDHTILQNEYRENIKKGDDLGKIPNRYEDTLKSEGVV